MTYHASSMETNESDPLIIESTQTYLIEVPVPVLKVDSSSAIAAWQVLAVRIRSHSGIEGWGYQTGFGAIMPILRRFLEREILPQLIGLDALDHRRWWSDVYLHRHHTGLHGPTLQGISAPEVAAWDLIARSQETPLWAQLGAKVREKIPCYNTDVGWIGFTTDQLIANVKQAIDDGFTAVKIKIGSDEFDDDLRRLEAVRNAAGSAVTVSVDVNSKWDLQTALGCAPALSDFDIAWLEEPLYPFDVQGHAALAEVISTPLLHGESICEPLMIRDMIAAGAMDIAQPSNMKLGGISRWILAAGFAQSGGLSIVPAGWTMMQIDQHLAAVTPECRMVEWIPWIRHLFEDSISYENGHIVISDAPGASTKIKSEFLG